MNSGDCISNIWLDRLEVWACQGGPWEWSQAVSTARPVVDPRDVCDKEGTTLNPLPRSTHSPRGGDDLSSPHSSPGWVSYNYFFLGILSFLFHQAIHS